MTRRRPSTGPAVRRVTTLHGLVLVPVLAALPFLLPSLRASFQTGCPSYFTTYGLTGKSCEAPGAVYRLVLKAMIDSVYPPAGGYPAQHSEAGSKCAN